jgi:hypothetical protein
MKKNNYSRQTAILFMLAKETATLKLTKTISHKKWHLLIFPMTPSHIKADKLQFLSKKKNNNNHFKSSYFERTLQVRVRLTLLWYRLGLKYWWYTSLILIELSLQLIQLLSQLLILFK